MSSQYCLFCEKYALDFADQYLKWLQITYILFVNTENRMSLRVEGIAQWESCAASFFGIPANILLLGKSLNCLYLSQFLTDFHFLKKHLNASVLPQFWSTHLTSSFNFKFFKTGRANSHCAMFSEITDFPFLEKIHFSIFWAPKNQVFFILRGPQHVFWSPNLNWPVYSWF